MNLALRWRSLEFQALDKVGAGFQVGSHLPIVEVEMGLEKENHGHSFPREFHRMSHMLLSWTTGLLVLCPSWGRIHTLQQFKPNLYESIFLAGGGFLINCSFAFHPALGSFAPSQISPERDTIEGT
jgi:hypothetical protein